MTTKKNARKRKEDVEAGPFLEQLADGPLTLARMLWAIRRGEGVSQAEMARLLGISRANLCDIEKGRKAVSAARAAYWAKLLGYSPAEFVRLALQAQLQHAGLKMVLRVEPAPARKGKVA